MMLNISNTLDSLVNSLMRSGVYVWEWVELKLTWRKCEKAWERGRRGEGAASTDAGERERERMRDVKKISNFSTFYHLLETFHPWAEASVSSTQHVLALPPPKPHPLATPPWCNTTSVTQVASTKREKRYPHTFLTTFWYISTHHWNAMYLPMHA